MSSLIPMLSAKAGLNEFDVRRILVTAPSRYKTYSIAKRNGDKRRISQPAREVKALQRIFLEQVLRKLPVHPAATAYRDGISIKANALPHAGDGPIRKFDFKDFFPSIKETDWRIYCLKNDIFSDPEDIHVSTRLLFFRMKGSTVLRLSIGAPTSPIVSNILMYQFDERMSELAKNDHVTYTRYADDITFSAKRTGFLNGAERSLKTLVKEVASPSLKLNNDKRVSATRKYKRFVTGLVLANDGSVTLGQQRKREIRAAVHHALLGKLDVKQMARLSGMLAFVNAVEPGYLKVLQRKYGDSILLRIRRAPRQLDQ
jgi:hypothetical protein